MSSAFSARSIHATWLGEERPLYLSTANTGHIYLGVNGVGNYQEGITRVNIDRFFTELADVLGKRIIVQDVEIVPAVPAQFIPAVPASVTIKNEVTYGG